MKKAIVTGANGFIGKWLVKELVEHHVMVYAIVHTPSKCFSNIPSDMLHVISCDMEHIDELKEKIQEKDLDVFFTLLGQALPVPHGLIILCSCKM